MFYTVGRNYLDDAANLTHASLWGVRDVADERGRDFHFNPLLGFQVASAGFEKSAVIETYKAVRFHFIFLQSGTDGGNRTHTPLRAPDFESGASASSATTAFRVSCYTRNPTGVNRRGNVLI